MSLSRIVLTLVIMPTYAEGRNEVAYMKFNLLYYFGSKRLNQGKI